MQCKKGTIVIGTHQGIIKDANSLPRWYRIELMHIGT